MYYKLSLNILIFISISFFLISCGQNASISKLPNAGDSTANIEAVKELSKAIEESPEDAELLYRRAQVYVNEKYLNRAEDDFLAAIAIDSINPLYHFNLARTLYAMNQTQRAATSYEKAISLKSDYQDAILKLADLYFIVKEYNKSIALLNKGMKLDQGNATIYQMLGLNYKEMGDTARAIYHFQTAIENDATDYESTLYIANLYAARRNQLAFDYFKAAIKLQPKNPDAWFSRAVFEQKLRLNKNSLIDYRRVIDLNPENYLAYYNVGYINFENGTMDEALRNWNTCTQMNPSFANAFYMKGLIYEERKNKVDARINYKVALELEPSNALFKAGLARLN